MARLDEDRSRWQGRPSVVLRLLTVAGLFLFWPLAPGASATTSPGLAEAIGAQRSRLEAAPRDVVVMNDLANLLVLAGDDEEAEELYRRALEIEPERVTTIYNLALLEMDARRRKLARRGFQKALKIDPGHAWSHYQLGTLAAAGGNRSRAIDHYTRAFRLEPRLTRPDFNPHIIDNDLVIEALLISRAADAAAAAVPRIYQNPERVRELLLPRPEALPKGSPESHRRTTSGGGGIRRSGGGPGGEVRESDEPAVPPAPEPVDAEPETEPGAPRDDAPDSETAGSRQDPGGRAAQQPIVPVPTRVPAAAEAPSAGPTGGPEPSGRATPGAEVTPPPAEAPSVPEAPAPAATPESAPDPPEFEPDLGSTGRLELRLVPIPQDRLAAVTAPRR